MTLREQRVTQCSGGSHYRRERSVRYHDTEGAANNAVVRGKSLQKGEVSPLP